MRLRVALSTVALLFVLITAGGALGEPPGLEFVPVGESNLPLTDGEALYGALCVACHGPVGVGDGPAAELLSLPPADLTHLSERNEGRFPSRRVMHAISRKHYETSGESAMPRWESLLGGANGNEFHARLRVYHLTQYVKELQAGKSGDRLAKRGQ